MVDLDERFDRLLERTRSVVAAQRKAKEEARRAEMSPAMLRTHVGDLWSPIREALIRQIKLWDNRLLETGVRVETSVESDASSQIVEKLHVRVSTPDSSAGHGLLFSVVASPKPYVTYSGPKGHVINGDQNTLPLDGLEVETLTVVALRHIERRVATFAERST